MGFGDSVTALLDTYSNCLKLLGAFWRPKGDGRDDEARDATRLCRSIKSDRERVRRAYSASLSEAGSRLEKGDSEQLPALPRHTPGFAALTTACVCVQNRPDRRCAVF